MAWPIWIICCLFFVSPCNCQQHFRVEAGSEDEALQQWLRTTRKLVERQSRDNDRSSNSDKLAVVILLTDLDRKGTCCVLGGSGAAGCCSGLQSSRSTPETRSSLWKFVVQTIKFDVANVPCTSIDGPPPLFRNVAFTPATPCSLSDKPLQRIVLR
jgi:hypothetical protein